MRKFIILLSALIIGLTGNNVLADTATTNLPETYSVSPIISAHQTEGVDSFFDIRWTPSETEKFGVLITNNSNHAQTYVIQVNKARTNKNGMIDYSDQTPEKQTTMYQLTKMIQLPKEVTVAGRHSQTIEGSLTFPESSFNGLLMAGLHISEKKSEKKEATIANTIAYNLPFVVRGNIDTRPKAHITLEKYSIEPFSSTQSSLDILLSNGKATLLKESEFVAEIKDSHNKTIVKQSSKLDITPETSFIYPIKLPEKLNAGDYQLVLKVKHKKDKWVFKKAIHLSSQKSKEIRQRALGKDNIRVFYGLLILSAVCIHLLLWLFLKKRKKKHRNKHQKPKHHHKTKRTKQ
ncbi:WxL protein peptidoglycan domain-containing protein [Enterococcus villorum]|uniref:DUF916 domain-containing protein n=1 Tax=Enterococcus villorum TaxID=112904 RepID=UPI003F8A5892